MNFFHRVMIVFIKNSFFRLENAKFVFSILRDPIPKNLKGQNFKIIISWFLNRCNSNRPRGIWKSWSWDSGIYHRAPRIKVLSIGQDFKSIYTWFLNGISSTKNPKILVPRYLDLSLGLKDSKILLFSDFLGVGSLKI